MVSIDEADLLRSVCRIIILLQYSSQFKSTNFVTARRDDDVGDNNNRDNNARRDDRYYRHCAHRNADCDLLISNSIIHLVWKFGNRRETRFIFFTTNIHL